MTKKDLEIVAKYQPYSQINFNDIAFLGLAAVIFHTTIETCDNKDKSETLITNFDYDPIILNDDNGNISIIQAIDNPTHWQMFLIANNALLITGEKEDIIYTGFHLDSNCVDLYKDGNYRRLINLWLEADYESCFGDESCYPLPENETLDPDSPFYDPYAL